MAAQSDESVNRADASQQVVQLQHSSSSSNASSQSSSSLHATSTGVASSSNTGTSSQTSNTAAVTNTHSSSVSMSASSIPTSSSSTTRSRSNSESRFKSSIAEKRKGRLFKPTSVSSSSTSLQSTASNNNSSTDGAASSSSTLANTGISTEASSANKVTSSVSNLTTNKSYSGLSNLNAELNSLSSQQPPALTKQVTSYFSSQVNQQQQQPSIQNQNQAQTIHQQHTQSQAQSKLQHSLDLDELRDQLTRNSKSTSNNAYMSPPMSVSIHSSTSSVTSSNDQDIAHKNTGLNSNTNKIISPSNTGLNSPAFPPRKSSVTSSHLALSERSKLASVDEIETKFKKHVLKADFDTLHKLSNRLKNVYTEVLRLAKYCNCTGYSTLSTVNTLEKLEDEIDNHLAKENKSVLLNTMGSFCKVLSKFLSIFSNSINEEYQSSMLRMLYMSISSLMVDLAKVCNVIDPKTVGIFSQQQTRKSSLPSTNQSNSQIGSTKSALHSNGAQSQTTKIRSQQILKVKRAPAPLSQGQLPHVPSFNRQASTSGSINNSSSSLANSRQASVPLKIDTTNLLNRQDSEIETPLHTAVYHSSQNDEDKLYDLIAYTAKSAQVVFSQLNDAISKSTVAAAQSASKQQSGNDNVAASNGEESTSPNSTSSNATEQPQFEMNNVIALKVKELTTYCVVSMDQTKKIRSILAKIRTVAVPSEDQQRQLYDETNMFLKSIIGILAATKAAITDLPQLNEVRGALSTLTRATKELTIKLEASALKTSVITSSNAALAAVENHPPSLSAIPSVSNFAVHSQQQQQQQSQFTSPTATGSASQSLNLNMGNSSSTPLHFPVRSISTTSNADNNHTNDNPSNLHPVSESSTESTENISLKQHIRNLQHSDLSATTPSSLSVTTPLVASIGPAAASAVLPVVSPLNGQTPPTANISSVFNNSNSSTNVTGLAAGENPFEKMVYPNSNTTTTD